MNELFKVKEICDKLMADSSRTGKERILEENKDNELFKEILKFLLDDDFITGISTKKLKKKIENHSPIGDILDILDYLKVHNTGTDNDISIVKGFIISQDESLHEFLEKLITKKLKLGVTKKTVNKIYPNFLEEFSIQLGSKFDMDKPPKETMYVTEKLDGIRAFTLIENRKVTIKTRQGKIISGLKDVEESILKATQGFDNIFLDGELLSISSSYEDVYKDTIKKVNNKNEIKTGVCYNVFDIGLLEEFRNKKGEMLYERRRELLNSLYTNDFVKIVPLLYKGNDLNKIIVLLNEYRDKGAEGLMVSLNKPYEFKRSKNLLKLKVMQSCDLEIISFEEGEGRLSGTLGKIICDYKGYKLGVGSGFTDADREEIWNNREKYLGRIVEINYFEETHNENGELSLRFPVFKCVREEGKEVSYN